MHIDLEADKIQSSFLPIKYITNIAFLIISDLFNN